MYLTDISVNTRDLVYVPPLHSSKTYYINICGEIVNIYAEGITSESSLLLINAHHSDVIMMS